MDIAGKVGMELKNNNKQKMSPVFLWVSFPCSILHIIQDFVERYSIIIAFFVAIYVEGQGVMGPGGGKGGRSL
jgi:hypothetical protein